MKVLFLCSWFFATAFAVSDVGVKDKDLSHFLNGSATSGAGSAARWLFDRRDEWGPFTLRAVVALSVAEGAGAHSLPQGEWALLAKQLNVLVTIEVGRDAIHEIPLSVSRLSHFVHALLATCQDPRHFHGLDLVRRLRSDADRLPGDGLPIAYVALCLAGEATHADLGRLSRMYQHSANRTDAQALQLLAMSCITALPAFSSARPIFASYLREFAAHFHASLKRGTTDVYTKAMAMQALNSADSADLSLGVSSLLSDQLADGSFERSLLATYHAIPALLDTSLLALKDARCPHPNSSKTRDAAELESPAGVVRLSLWVGEGAERDTHTVSVAAGANRTLLDVMRAASERNEIFRFSYDVTPSGARVFSVAGLPNDSELQTSWQLYVQKSGQHERLHLIKDRGVDRVFPSAEDNIVFWFKRDSML